jgi:hypothetical protein
VTIGALLLVAEGDEVATLRDHLAGQDGDAADAAARFSRGAKIGKRAGESETKEEMAFLPISACKRS